MPGPATGDSLFTIAAWRSSCAPALLALCVLTAGCIGADAERPIRIPPPSAAADDVEEPSDQSPVFAIAQSGDRAAATASRPSAGESPDGAAAAFPPESSPSHPHPAASPDVRPDPPTPSVERRRVDALIGQINGRPLYASEFFATMDARLRAEAERRTPEEWIDWARSEIRSALRDRIRDELLLAEIDASLTEQQRAGLVNFVRSLREGFISESRGSAEIANRRFLETTGQTLEDTVRAKRDEELINSWLRNILRTRIAVSWRDVQQRYERDHEIYNPPPSAALRMIRVSATDAEAIEMVRSGLENGEHFELLASRFSRWAPEEGGAYIRTLDGETYRDSTIFAIDALNDAAHQLSEGEVAGPIESGASVYWIQLDEVRTGGRSLYEVQNDIFARLFAERVREEENQYFQSLVDRSSVTELQQMQVRLQELAIERYLLSQRIASP